jgi:hypothetical protein
VPGPGDDVTIVAGSAVVIDTDVTIGNITVGNSALIPGVLTFDSLGARSFTVNGDLTISGGANILTTPDTGSITGHTLTVGGNLTNNGILDLSTNNNQAGAGLVFKNASNNTFGGGGSMTDIRTVTIDKGAAIANTLDLTVSNFTVQGSSVDTASSGYLTLTNGTFKISGSFSGNHRTFATAAYTFPATAGFWLNNPNYTVTAQTGDVVVSGTLQISAGVYNVGTAATDALRIGATGPTTGGMITVEGGSLNVSGAMRRGDVLNRSYNQFGGTVTTCIAGNIAPCFDLSSNGEGGKLVIQTPAAVPNPSVPDFSGTFLWGTALTFGNANTPGTGVFTAATNGWSNGAFSSLNIDTTAGPHTLKVTSNSRIYDINIGPGGTLDLGNYQMQFLGKTFVNNGILKVNAASQIRVSEEVRQEDVTFSGNGIFSGPIGFLSVDRRNLILGPGVNIQARDLDVGQKRIINAFRLTIGLNDNIASTVSITTTGSLDSAPTFQLGTGGQKMIYNAISGTRNSGPELSPAGELAELTITGTSSTVLNITGGDLILNGPLQFIGVINMGGSRLRHLSGTVTRNGSASHIIGTIGRRFNTAGEIYTFHLGDNNQHAPVNISATSLPSGPAEIAITGRFGPLPDLDPSRTLKFRWEIVQTGSMTSNLDLMYSNGLIVGAEGSYRSWRSIGGGSPIVISSTVSTSTNTVTALGLSDLAGSWGLSERPPLISISGTIFADNGAGLRNATVRLSGGNLTTPRVAQTGNFGTYSFTSVEPGQYTVSVSAKRSRFTTSNQSVSTMTNVTNLNFTANPPE